MEDDSLALHVILFVHAMYSWIVGPVVGTWTLLKLITGRQATNTQVIPIIQTEKHFHNRRMQKVVDSKIVPVELDEKG